MSNSSTVAELEGLLALDSAKRLVTRLAANGDRVHSVLFYGAELSGKRTLAQILAKAWLCQAATAEGACDVCRSCNAFDNDHSVDLLRVAPKGPSSIIRLGSIVPRKPDDKELPETSIQEFLRTPPMTGRRKIVIIESADRMNNDAANALLKTLEEPPDFAKLILTTDSVGKMTPTVLSRCVTIKCETPETSRYPASDLDPRLLAAEDGGPGKVRRLVDHREWYEAMLAFAHDLPLRPRGEALKASADFKSLCEFREAEFKEAARAANTGALAVLANLLEHETATPGRWQPIVEAHRRMLGNGAAGAVLDALFTRLLQ